MMSFFIVRYISSWRVVTGRSQVRVVETTSLQKAKGRLCTINDPPQPLQSEEPCAPRNALYTFLLALFSSSSNFICLVLSSRGLNYMIQRLVGGGT